MVVPSPGVEDIIVPKLETASKELAESAQLDTLLLVFSGHHELIGDEDQFTMGGEQEKISTDKLFFSISEVIKKVDKIIVLLDCCYARVPCFCSRISDTNSKAIFREKAVIQINSCSSKQESLFDRNGSYFLQTFIQAFSLEVKDSCFRKSGSCQPCAKWNTEKNEIAMLSRVFEYMEDHADGNVTPKITMINCSTHDEVLAFKADMQVNVSITCKFPTKTSFKLKKCKIETTTILKHSSNLNYILLDLYTGRF